MSMTTLALLVICLGAVFALALFVVVIALQNRTATLEDRQGFPSSAAGSRPAFPAPEVDVTIQALLAQGKKIEAIKLYRQATGVGLKEAIDAVEAMQAR